MLEAGQTLTHHEILGPPGSGAMGEVYRARDTRPQCFEREARTLASLSHANLAHVDGIGQVGDTCLAPEGKLGLSDSGLPWSGPARFGFMPRPHVPRVLVLCRQERGLEALDPKQVSCVLGRETLLAAERPGMALWRARFFAFLARNAGRATACFSIPPDRVLEIGAQVELRGPEPVCPGLNLRPPNGR